MLELLNSFVPTPHTLAVVVPLAFIYTLAMALVVGTLRCKHGVRTAYTRKIFHFSIFTMAGIVHVIWHLPGVCVLGTVVSMFVLYAIFRGRGLPFYEALARPTDAPRRTLFVLVPLATTILGGLTTNILFPGAAYIGYLVCGWGDAVGEPVGTRWGKHTYRVPSLGNVPAVRSLEGSLAVFVVGSLAAIIGFYFFTNPPAHLILIGCACGFFAALVEAFSNHGLDNFTTQVAAAAVAALLA